MTAKDIELPLLSVSALTQSIKTLLETHFRFIAVQGEVSNSKLQSSGHFYFSLKDKEAQIAAVMFKTDVSLLDRLPKDGDQVIVKGTLNVYPPSGKYQIVARTLELAGVGALLLKLEALKVKLKEKGYFSSARKKKLPCLPRKIGVVTSPTGAVIQDILHVLTRRFSDFHLILNPVKVQGVGAKEEIAAAIDFFNKSDLVDVIIIGRGGGTLEDLWAFNEEMVADAIFRSHIPIISAVGHETDHCIADYVADVRAPTPSAAAEMVMAERGEQLKALNRLTLSLNQCIFHLLRNGKEKLNGLQRDPLFSNPYALLSEKMQRIDEFKIALDRRMEDMLKQLRLKLMAFEKQNQALKPSTRIIHCREKLGMVQKNLDQSFAKYRQQKKKQLEQISLLLKALDPRNLLSKGYCVVFSEKTHSIITSISTLSKGDPVQLLFADGKAHSTINEISCP